jgi:DNA replication ATP-dependent helicase Dna2
MNADDIGQTGDLVKDWRRMNVSFTRARRKLIIFGSRSTLQADQLLHDFFLLMESRGWILQLPPGSFAAHHSAFDKPADKPASHCGNMTFPCTPGKRFAETDDGKENTSPERHRPWKKTKISGSTIPNRPAAGILKGRLILQDLVNEEA